MIKDKHHRCRQSQRVQILLFTLGLSLIVLMVVSAVQAPVIASAYYPFKSDGPNSVVGLKYWHLMWDYNATKTEKQNLKDFEKWWCTDSNGNALKHCNNKEDVQDMHRFMLFVKEHILQIISIKVTEFWASHPNDPHTYETIHKDKTTKEGTKNWFLTAYGKDGRTQKLYSRYEALAFHSDKNRSEEQNLKAFKDWWCRAGANDPTKGDPLCSGSPSKLLPVMQFNDYRVDMILFVKAMNPLNVEHKVTKSVIKDWVWMEYNRSL